MRSTRPAAPVRQRCLRKRESLPERRRQTLHDSILSFRVSHRRPDPGAYDPKAPPAPYAALAKVQWERTGKEGLLLLIKPRVNFTEPPELLAYRQREAGRDFPQQATLDQFFDEEQWEAYRRFGQVVGDRIFGESTGWAPARLIREIVPEPPGRGKQAPATGGEDADA